MEDVQVIAVFFKEAPWAIESSSCEVEVQSKFWGCGQPLTRGLISIEQTPWKRGWLWLIRYLGLAVNWSVIRGAAPAKRLWRCIFYSGVICRSHPFLPVVQLIGLQYFVLVAESVLQRSSPLMCNVGSILNESPRGALLLNLASNGEVLARERASTWVAVSDAQRGNVSSSLYL